MAARIAAGGFQHARQARQQAADAPATGLSAVRDEPEHHSRDPFKADVTAVLAELEPDWGDRYRLGYDGRSWTAEPRAGGATLRALSPDDLIADMREATT